MSTWFFEAVYLLDNCAFTIACVRQVKRVGNALKAAEETTTAIKMKLDQAIKSSKQEISKWVPSYKALRMALLARHAASRGQPWRRK